ncbi:uncharacterized protein LOC126985259 [Eriocheir sinensis]|uniref:uncharacterized protein LOC126985259 n=1 Tax=Eriocheir sinensis TaxID=95602 RepID=UPI0021C76D4E|nr:uncharacterized protein LOC126985259 [Eriocheir sinensis]XP_050695839.1 uncharacterized protein LOC126985259 [Eriocheir sinensis]XP_050695840.1 uncharacterized protein LOC126985259 [Eriocheir sinensis]XP_050695841.1 uncharacterized protein LOC126985259 [Eriocheir sinensis]XP_050695842.1 uncharacterized protein LOC126985259 [Eriocheir sinensis]XP_050695843.1 uncharacterized protein LOC126985259 [Eriocheir sinensis]XP_050695844.1 uncharacterized protein LOC126985259 [Eriocheir sinensis]XP_0
MTEQKRKPNMTPHQLILAFIYFFVLLVILPVFCSDKIYSLFYQEDPLRNQEIEVVKREHRRQGVKEYLGETDEFESLAFHRTLLRENLDHLIVIIAKKPEYEEDKVLSQLVTEVDRNIRSQRLYRNALVICNASRSPFEELRMLSRRYPVIEALNSTKWKLVNKEEAIRHDFMDCVGLGRSVAQFNHLTVIRDVVVPYPGFLETLNQILHLRIDYGTVRGELRARGTPWLFLHLHEPVPFRQYQVSWESLWELLMLALSGGLLFHLIFRYLEGPTLQTGLRVTYTLYGALYFVTFAVVVGRPYITELRRYAAGLFRIYDPLEPVHFSAVTLPFNILQSLLTQLSMTKCSIYSPFHEALDHMVNTLECPGFVLSPSLVSYAVRTPTPPPPVS